MRRCRGVACVAIILSTAFLLIVYLAPITTFVVRLFSVHYSRKATSILFGIWLSLWPFLFEKINKTKVVFSGENVTPKRRVLLFANHRTEVDWMYLWDLALRKGYLGYINEKKCIKSQEYASEHGLPKLEHVLLPKTKGFICCLQQLRSSLDAVYDVTIAYKHRLPDFLDNVYGVDPSEVHIHIRTVQLSDIPTSEDEITEWMIERFRQKDQLLSDFVAKGHFLDEGTEEDLSTPKCLANFSAIVGLTGICLYLTLCSSVWFKVYVVASCAYLSFVTYYSILPPQLVGSPEGAKKAV
ncbi:putative 1-acyl-sn-glycerol-3-phosphate acyltransferase 5 [Panicum miliaceum]|uniref:1-acylglycerol-3-phosphate O-acyltransferase n=1 Tax=Panicum miliaceum TaxID=4540 RepID=A0A3L6R380_PANMI|nr:putative 1-acyl-sn-glycerol-3-phosphate acyltransferase 5 [Panicum miliaceum]